MKKRKVQTVVYYQDEQECKYFLLLKTNERRGFFWQNVTGAAEISESYNDAAVREAQEETSLEASNIKRVTPTQLLLTFRDQWGHDVEEKVFIIECFNKWAVQLDPEEHIDFRWVPQYDINKDTFKYNSNYQAILEAVK